MNLRSISFRLIAWYAGLLAAIFLLLSGLLYLNLRLFLENDLRQVQLRRAHQVANALLLHVHQTGEPYVVELTRDWYEPEINDRFIRITRADGTVLYASGRPKDDSFDPSEVPVPGAFSGTDLSRKVKLSNGKTLSTVALSFQPAGQAAYVIEFGELLDPVETMLSHLFLQLAIGLPVAVLFIAGGGYWLLRRALTPVAQITRAAESITQQNLAERLPVAQTGDELERLSTSLNRMIARLDEAFQNSQRFVADASHDLRTPLTIMRGELESLHADTRLDPELRGRVESILEEAVHFSKIVEQLFLLSRLDAGEGRTEWTRFDLAELARNTADQLSLLAEDKKISITCDASQVQLVEGDSVRLKQVIVNLLDNAIKYTPEQGAVRLRVLGRNGHVVLEVKDNGIGIPAEALPHIFERFYRVDKARSRDQGGTGLGLAIVKHIVQAHGGEVRCESGLGHGATFYFTLPASETKGS